jgi:hypothetical protein
MQLEIYNAVKAQLDLLTDLKVVGLWNNQFSNESTEIAIDYPNAFIEFANIEYESFPAGMQRYTMDIIIHVGFKSFKSKDETGVFAIKQLVYGNLGYFSSSNDSFTTKLLRTGEVIEYNHGSVQDCQITFRASGKDFGVTTLPTTDATVNTIVTTLEPHITNDIIRTAKEII